MRDEAQDVVTDDIDDAVDELLAIEGENAPEKIEGVRGATGPRENITPVERRKRRQSMSNLIASGRSDDEIILLMEKQYGLNREQIIHLRNEIFERWAAEDKSREPYLKGAARRRILNHVVKASSDKQWTAVAAFEKTLASIEGTLESDRPADPQEVRVNIAVLNMLGGLDEETFNALAERGKGLYLDIAQKKDSGVREPIDAEIVDKKSP